MKKVSSLGVEMATPNLSNRQREVLDFITGHGGEPVSQKAIAERFGFTSSRAGQYVQLLERRGLIQRVAHGKYRPITT